MRYKIHNLKHSTNYNLQSTANHFSVGLGAEIRLKFLFDLLDIRHANYSVTKLIFKKDNYSHDQILVIRDFLQSIGVQIINDKIFTCYLTTEAEDFLILEVEVI